MQGGKCVFILLGKAENNLKKAQKGPAKPCRSRYNLHLKARWVASNVLYRFQHPAAAGSREACDPRIEYSIPYNEMWVKKDLSRTPQGNNHDMFF